MRRRFADLLRGLRARLWPGPVVDLAGLAGVGCTLHGVALLSVPAAWILGGAALVAIAVIAGRGAR